MQNTIMYDWVSITSKIHSPDDFIRLLGLDDPAIVWQTTKGAHGYRDRLYWERISIHYNGGSPDMGIWLEMSGQGCRAFESFGSGDYDSLFREVADNPGEMKITRLDVAFDDHEGLLDIHQICEDTRNQEYVSKFRSWQVIDSDGGASLVLGSYTSDVLIRIYDKAAERGCTDGRHWVRVELQLRRDRAQAFVDAGGDVGIKFRGVLSNYARYVDEPDGYDSNRWRWPCKRYWAALLEGVARIQIFTQPGTDYNMVNLETQVFVNNGNAIYTYLETHTVEQFMATLKELRPKRLNPKYAALIAEYGRHS